MKSPPPTHLLITVRVPDEAAGAIIRLVTGIGGAIEAIGSVENVPFSRNKPRAVAKRAAQPNPKIAAKRQPRKKPHGLAGRPKAIKSPITKRLMEFISKRPIGETLMGSILAEAGKLDATKNVHSHMNALIVRGLVEKVTTTRSSGKKSSAYKVLRNAPATNGGAAA